MSIKIYNPKTGKWEKNASIIANSIKVIDLPGNFESEDVDGALNELADKIKDMKNDIKYIYENGTIGGGGNGGASTPLITIDGPNEYIVNSNQTIDIFYYFTSPNPGNGVVNITVKGKVIQNSVPQSRNKVTLGPFERGTHVVTISVMDKQGFWSVPKQIKVISGSLEIKTLFDDSRDFTLNDEVIIPYEILTEVNEPVFVDYVYNGNKFTIQANIGANELNLGKLPYMGISTFSMVARNSKYQSNEIRFILVATDSSNLFVSTTFDKETFELGRNLQIPFRISMKNQYSFYSDYYIDDKLITTVTTYPGVNFWNVGTNLDIGHHTLKIVTKTTNGMFSTELVINVEIVSSGYEPYRHVRTGLIAEYDATGKVNNSSNQKVWEDTSGNGVACNLYNFNYTSNGWMNNALNLSGKSYAEINLKPFLNGVKSGFTIDVLCKIELVGNIDACVLSCKNPVTPFQGFQINTWNTSLTSKLSETISAQIQDNTWTKVTYVIDRSNKMMVSYINGIISSVSHLQPNDINMSNYTDEFTFDGKILIGANLDINGNVSNHSVSSVKSVRIYNRALNDNEILQNYIADYTTEEEQMKIRDLNTTEEGMPTISFIGNFEQMDENSERIGQISYNDPKDPSKVFIKDGCLISWQGTSSKNYPVKNWTIKLRDGGVPSLNYAPKNDWKPEDRWTLKANFMDSSHANNVGTCKFINDFFKPYPYPSQIADPKTRSSVDGFPVRLQINGEDVGIYTWNIDRYALNNYGFVTYNTDGTVNRHANAVSYEIGVNSSSGAGAFHDDSWDSIRSEFKCRYNYRGEESVVTEKIPLNGVVTTVLKTGMHNELQALVTWVKNSSDEQFRSELEEHFSKRHLIDYYLIAYVFGMVDNLGKNMVLSTWGKNSQGNTVWYPSFYDVDSLYGLNNSGIIAFNAGLDMDKGDYNTSRSMLWTKLVKMFGQEIRERYHELRLNRTINGVPAPPIFSYENIMSYIGNEVMDTIGQKFYNEDARVKYLNEAGYQWLYLCSGNRRQFTERWLKERFIYMDSVYQFNYDSKAVLRSYAQGNLNLRIKTYSPQWILVSFSDAANTKVKLYVEKAGYTDFSMFVNNGTDNNIEIYGCDNIMYIDGIKKLDVRSINIANAYKLVELDISNSNRIEEISLGNNRYLQKVLCNDCSSLGKGVDNRTLDLSKCSTLRELDCSNTHIANIIFSSTGGVIESLNCSNTAITSFNLYGQEYLKGVKLDDCYDLSEMSIINCNGIEAIEMANTKLASVKINGCEKLDFVDISYTKALRSIDLNGCPNITTLLMAGVSNVNMKDLNLTSLLNLSVLDITGSSFIETITFGQYKENGVTKNFNKLKVLRAENSSLKSIRYGAESPILAYLDLNGLTLDEIRLKACANLKEIRNINLIAESGYEAFHNCYNLEKIQGYIKLIGDASFTFYNCGKLSGLPTLDLSEVVYMGETFANCHSLTASNVRQIMINSNISSKFASSWGVFKNCYNVTGTIPADTFSKCVGLDNASAFFYGCSWSGSLPETIFNPMPKLLYAEYTFFNNSLSGQVPTNIFKNIPLLESVNYIFAHNDFSGANLDELFKYNPNLRKAQAVFTYCHLLTLTISENLFLNNPNIEDVADFFFSCGKVTGSIPRNIFNNIPKTNGTNKLLNIEGFFADTGISGTIPAYISESQRGLLDSCLLLDNVSWLFEDTSITGVIPPDIFKYNNNITNASGVFSGCSGLGDFNSSSDIPPNLFKGKTRLADVSFLFDGCSGLYGSIPAQLFYDCPLINSAHNLFNGCKMLNGEIPRRKSTWSKAPHPTQPGVEIDVETVQQYGLFDKCLELINVSGAFFDCNNLTGEIPSTLLMNANKVTDASHLFARCFNLYGPVPKDLFKNCTNLTTIDSAFADCVNLHNYIVDGENPYVVSPDLFKNCINLRYADHAFAMWGEGLPSNSKLNGAIPPDLFKYNTKLISVEALFSNNFGITGELGEDLFRTNTALVSIEDAFSDTGITSINSKFLSYNTSLQNMSYAFNRCNSLRGNAPEYWVESHPINPTEFAACFRSCTGLTNYAQIPSTWK
ncbi:gp353 [Bacillus phage G]|uniref:Gp353 n=1 Tax=Bacillus phage G TaxID=2884420 RepID=G3MA94_9CAUD|nr:gp353 [Bacillus phage G]AEO93612.1 gp353 [Bacillus phage G]